MLRADLQAGDLVFRYTYMRLVFFPCGLEHAECRVESCPSIDIDMRNAARNQG